MSQTLRRRVELARAQLTQLRTLEALEVKAASIRTRADRARHERYKATPSAFVRDNVALPAGRTFAPYQLDALDELAEHHRLALRGPRGLGKTAVASLAVNWFSRTSSPTRSVR